MKDKEAISILMKLAERLDLSKGEKEALSSAIGILSWSTLTQGKIRSLRVKRDREQEIK